MYYLLSDLLEADCELTCLWIGSAATPLENEAAGNQSTSSIYACAGKVDKAFVQLAQFFPICRHHGSYYARILFIFYANL